jgi:hypothetical protein
MKKAAEAAFLAIWQDQAVASTVSELGTLFLHCTTS